MKPFQDDKWLSAVELTLHTMVGESATASVDYRRRCSLGRCGSERGRLSNEFLAGFPHRRFPLLCCAEQQKSSAEEHEEYGGPVYTFQRSATQPTDTLNRKWSTTSS